MPEVNKRSAEGGEEGEASSGAHIERRWPGQRNAAVALAVIAAAAASFALAGCGDDSSPHPKTTRPSARIRALNELLDSIPQNGNVLGSPSAPVTLKLFVDVECANTREFVQQALWGIVRRWVRANALRLEFHSIEDGSEPREAFLRSQLATLAAGRQNRLWYYLALYYDAQEELGPEMDDSCSTPAWLPTAVAHKTPGMTFSNWSVEQRQPGLLRQVVADERRAVRAALSGTPSLSLGRTGGSQWATYELTVDQSTRIHPLALIKAIESLVRRSHPSKT
jgi:Thioredoxin